MSALYLDSATVLHGIENNDHHQRRLRKQLQKVLTAMAEQAAALWIVFGLLGSCVLVGVNAQLAEVILSPNCGPGPTTPCVVMPVRNSKGDYIYDYQQELCNNFACQVTAVVSDPTWFCYDIISGMGAGYKTRVEIGAGIGALAVGKKEDNYAACQVARVKDLLSLGNCRDVELFTCNDCALAYKRWVCTKQFPKCIPYPTHFTVPRANASSAATTSSSSHTSIKVAEVWGYGGTSLDFVVNPCVDICHDVIRKCPPALLFTCPSDTRNYGDKPGCNNFNIPGF